jgi:hypothetical protein
MHRRMKISVLDRVLILCAKFEDIKVHHQSDFLIVVSRNQEDAHMESRNESSRNLLK